MILKGNQRAGAVQLARHLLNDRDNDHVSVHELRGFSAATLAEAMRETLAISKGTRCRQFLFSLSLNPPERATVEPEDLLAAADFVEHKLGLTGQPRAIVIHEKEGRRHAHAVWSRINADTMTAINLPYTKRKMQDVSRELFLHHGWSMPAGLRDPAERDPATFSRAEWQQAKRVGQDAKALKRMFATCWAASDNAESLKAALAERGLVLARGDRRGAVAVDYRGEVYALARWSGVKTKEVRARVGDPEALPGVDEAKRNIADRMTPVLRQYVADVRRNIERSAATVRFKAAQLKERHVAERDDLVARQDARWKGEVSARAARFRPGVRGLWDRVSGRHRETQVLNEREAKDAERRDRVEREALGVSQLNERRALQTEIKAIRALQHEEMSSLREDVATYAVWSGREVERPRHELDHASHSNQKENARDAENGPSY
ncbi:relaxase/mobilization nuclease domain-containing protein [Acuticoccus sp. MNP-M23]|uniref:relaxase/mobilization nuclease domain-containing protein n=1 Tax=Acuticoccus sp. MNP-M23 TaxID=3072793 RepID=UPI002815E197|nr:relaxase/mobilization nuclease domain-containing protein [Acuticoccus sp. MNP-M23]WMS43100.1 relaxase/mobilization nuclease domain-containing protein [Acuticoccus sp. MNP-M23]